MNNQKFLKYNIFTENLDSINLNGKSVIATLNPFSYLIAERDKKFQEALIQANTLLPDGEGIVWAVQMLYNKKIKKIAGYDIFIHLMKALDHNSGSCFFFGASDKTLQLIKNKIGKEYPNVTVNYFSPPFKDKFSDEEDAQFISLINLFKPDVLFVGMTAPKQEKWVNKNKEKLNVTIVASIGAVFDFYAGIIKRPSSFWINIGLEWFVRFLQEPRRLWKRNFIATPQFICQILKYKLKVN